MKRILAAAGLTLSVAALITASALPAGAAANTRTVPNIPNRTVRNLPDKPTHAAAIATAVSGMLSATPATSRTGGQGVQRAAPSRPLITNGGYYQIVNQNSGKCLEVYHSETTNLANVDQYTCASTPNKIWILIYQFTLDQSPVYELENSNSGKCAEVYHSETTNLANVDQYACNGTDNQLWLVAYNSNLHAYAFINDNSARCMEVYHSEITNLANVDQYTCQITPNKFWYLNSA